MEELSRALERTPPPQSDDPLGTGPVRYPWPGAGVVEGGDVDGPASAASGHLDGPPSGDAEGPALEPPGAALAYRLVAGDARSAPW